MDRLGWRVAYPLPLTMGAGRAQASLLQKSIKVDVVGVGGELARAFCPSGTAYAALNLPEMDTPWGTIYQRKGQTVEKAIIDGFNRKKRQVTINDKRQRIVQSIIADPSTPNGMTRIWHIIAHEDDVEAIQN